MRAAAREGSVRAAIYARRSTDEHQQASLDVQVSEAKRFIAAKGWTLDEACVFVDDGISRTEFVKRAGLIRLLLAAEEHAFDIVVTVTPGRELLFPEGSLRDGQHVSMMGADGPGKAEVAVGELARADLFCDDWEQASHGGELAAGVDAGVVTRDRVTDIGRVLSGDAEGRRSAEDITLFDSTGLAIQDLAIAKVASAKADAMELQRLAL